MSGGRDATATLFLLLDLATFFDLFHGGKLDEALDTLEKIKIIPLAQQDVDYLVAGRNNFKLKGELAKNTVDMYLHACS